MASIKLKHATGNSTIVHSPAANPTNDITLKLPSTTGSAGQVLKVASANHSATNAELEFTGGGKILQVQKVIKLDTASQAVTAGSSWSYNPSDFRVTITPSSASNKIVLIGQITVGISVVANIGVSLDQDGSELDTTRAAADGSRSRATVTSGPPSASSKPISYSVVMEVDAGSTSERYYNYRIRHGSSSTRTLYVNRSGDDTNSVYSFRAASSLFAIEVAG
tara:strand:- start:210 stop:875 length:666 start_codon:yes stop_codon:yes gene_type:complete